MVKKNKFSCFIRLVAVLYFSATVALASSNKLAFVKGEKIALGMTTSLSGPSRDLGLSMVAGIQAYFDQVNQQGGINGQLLDLMVLDDGYQPLSALKNTQSLILENNIIAMIGNVGTPTAALTEPYCNSMKVTFFAPYTGADILRKLPPAAYTFNYRASYRDEMEVIIEYIFNQGIEPDNIVFFIQDDGYGLAGLTAARKALYKRGFNNWQALNILRYSRNTNDISAALTALLELSFKPKAIVLVAAYGASAKFINYSHYQFPKTLYFNLSFVGAHTLYQQLMVDTRNIYITQVVPPVNSDIALNKELKALLIKKKQSHLFNSLSLEGYIAAKLLVQALKRIQGEITSASLKQVLEYSGSFDIGLGSKLFFNKEKHQASDKVWLLQHSKDSGFSLLNEVDGQ